MNDVTVGPQNTCPVYLSMGKRQACITLAHVAQETPKLDPKALVKAGANVFAENTENHLEKTRKPDGKQRKPEGKTMEKQGNPMEINQTHRKQEKREEHEGKPMAREVKPIQNKTKNHQKILTNRAQYSDMLLFG